MRKKTEERLMWAWRWNGCKAIDPDSIRSTKHAVKMATGCLYEVNGEAMGKVVRVVVRPT